MFQLVAVGSLESHWGTCSRWIRYSEFVWDRKCAYLLHEIRCLEKEKMLLFVGPPSLQILGGGLALWC